MTSRIANPEDPVDLEFLAHQTMGDENLRDEVLDLFLSQIPIYKKMAMEALDSIEIKRVAHMIKGAAKGIGATKLSELAAAAERSAKFKNWELAAELDRIAVFANEVRCKSSRLA